MWSFEGTGDAVHFQEHDNGSFSIHGDLVSQHCSPSAGFGILEVVKNVNSLSFSVHPSDSKASEIDTFARSLREAFQTNPMRSHASIYYLPEGGSTSRNDHIAVTAILCERSIERIFDMYKRLFGRAEFHHCITLDFIGLLPEPRPESDILSIVEFTDPDILNRKAYLTNSVGFRFYAKLP